MANVLIIDDDRLMCESIEEAVRRLGHQAVSTYTLRDGLREALSGALDVIFLDVLMPDGNGLEELTRLRNVPSSPEIIIMTGRGDPDGAEIAIRSGAWDYIEKPSSLKELILPLTRALQYRSEKRGSHELSEPGKLVKALRREAIIGSSPPIKTCLELLANAAGSNANVLITGETGTGKELFAQAIHDNSPRANRGFVVVDCSALPATLVESLLFGYERGAFTGADKAQEGLIKQADGGTLFLDEIGELPISIQKTFLRVLQERSYRPLGSKQQVRSNFRLIAATNRDLDLMVQEGTFRDDLLFRLHSICFHLPPLRDRPGDIKELTYYHMNKLCDQYGIDTKGFSPEFFEALTTYEWPGNVRELFNVLEGIFATSRNDPTIFRTHLPMHIRIKVARSLMDKEKPDPASHPLSTADQLVSFRDFRRQVLAEADRSYLTRLMSMAKGSIEKACRVSCLSRSRLYGLLKQYDIKVPAAD